MGAPYDEMGEQFAQHAEDGAYNVHYDRPAVLRALGDVAGKRVLDAAIHYADDQPAAFAALHRVLRPGGALVVSTQHPTTGRSAAGPVLAGAARQPVWCRDQ